MHSFASQTARTGAAIIATAGLALPAAALGCSPGSHGTQLGSTATQNTANPPAPPARERALAFARCMRSHGVPNYPDPNRSGQLVKKTPQQLGVSDSQFQAAERACRHLLPSGAQPSQSTLQRSWNDFRNFARCMRRHGVANWPDPTRYPQHPERPTFDLQRAGIDPNAPQIRAKIHLCLPRLHSNNPQHLGEGG